MAVCSKRRQLFALLSLFLQSLVSASCRSRIDSSDLSNVSPTLLDQGLVKVSSTFYSDDGREHLKLSGYGFLVKVPAKANSNPIYFVVTASHLSQGGMNEFSGGDESRIDLSIEARFQGRVVKLEPINRVAALRRDIEVIHVKPVPGLEALATLTQDSGISPIIRANHPYGWLKVTHPNAIESLNGPMMNQNGLYPLSLLSAVPQSDFVRKIDRNPLSALRKSELEQIISASSDPWRVQMLKLGYELVLDEVETYRRLPAGFSGAPMISRVDQQWILFGMVTTYSRVFDLSWCLPSHFISRTINLYMQNILSSPPSKAAVLTNSEQWKLKQGLLYRQSRYEPDELGGAAYSEVSYTKTPSGNGSSSPGGNGSSSPGGNGSSSPGGNGSSSPGGNGSSSPGGDGTTALDVDVLSRLGLMYGLSFAAPKINGKTMQNVLGFIFDLEFQKKKARRLVDPNMSALNLVLNSLAPDYDRNPMNPKLKVTPIATYESWFDAVKTHLIASGFIQSGDNFTATVKFVSKDHGTPNPVSNGQLKIALQNGAVLIDLELDGQEYHAEKISSVRDLKPFLKLTSANSTKQILYMSLAGSLMLDASIQSPLDDLVRLPQGANAAWLFPKLKFMVRDETLNQEYLAIIP